MGFQSANCELCGLTTYHTSDSDEETMAKHNATPRHQELQKAWSEYVDSSSKRAASKSDEFNHGKDHNN